MGGLPTHARAKEESVIRFSPPLSLPEKELAKARRSLRKR